MLYKKKYDYFPKSNFVEMIRFTLKMFGNVFDEYFLNRFQRKSIHNDLGASFTNLSRKKGRIIKRAHSRGEEKLIEEIKWYQLFKKKKFRKFIPNIKKYSIKKGNVFYEMKYYTLPNLRKIILEDMNASFFIRMRWRRLFDILLKHLFLEEYSVPSYPDYAEKVHFAKFDSRMADARRDAPFFKSVFDAPLLQINDHEYINCEKIISTIRKHPEILKQITPDKLYYAHGDIHCNNILCGIRAKRLILLDCRGKNMDGSLYFDVAYDMAKINHDLRSMYSLIEKHQFCILLHEKDDNLKIHFTFNNQRGYKKFHGLYHYVKELIDTKMTNFGNVKYRSDFIESLLFLTMVPLHLKSRAEGLMCYVTGVIRLNEWLKDNHTEIYDKLLSEVK